MTSPRTSRWCQGPPEPATIYGTDPHTGQRTEEHFTATQRALCESWRWSAHNEAHRHCCWNEAETESRDCACPCHTGCPEDQHKN